MKKGPVELRADEEDGESESGTIISKQQLIANCPQDLPQTMHYGIRAMGARTLRNLELCPSF